MGFVKSCHKPCTAVDIDPNYSKDAALQSPAQKFQMKTDVLRLREIVRTKFLVYSTEERYLHKQQEVRRQEHTYKRIYSMGIFIKESIEKIEREAFDHMKSAQKRLKDLYDIRISDTYKETMAEHQRVMMDVQEIFGRFLFLLKLIQVIRDILLKNCSYCNVCLQISGKGGHSMRGYWCYFDDIIDPEDIQHNDHNIKIEKNCEIFNIVISDRQQIGKKELTIITDYMDKIVRPYLHKRNHLNADIWIKGYERSRQKIFNYYRRCSQMALLNYLITIMYNKKEKTFTRLTEKPIILKQPEFLKKRAFDLKQGALRLWDKFERKQKQDLLQMTMSAIVPVMLESIRGDLLIRDDLKVPGKANGKKQIELGSPFVLNGDILAMVEKLQWLLMNLLSDLEKIPVNQRHSIEKQVRKCKERKMANSSKALIEQNRFINWIKHFKKHQKLYQE